VNALRETPESFWQKNRRPAYPSDEQTFVQALNDVDLAPAGRSGLPASQTQRLMKVMALKQLVYGLSQIRQCIILLQLITAALPSISGYQ
jgi:hypothetical protein